MRERQERVARGGRISARVLAGIVLAGVTLAACGSSGERGSEAVVIRNPLAAAAVASADAGSARMTMKITMSSPGLFDDATMAADGVVDFTTQNAEMRLDMSDFAASFGSGSGLDPDELVLEMRVVDDVIYVRMPGGFGLGDEWLSMDIEDVTSGGISNDLAGQLGSTNPTQFLEYLAAVSDDVREAGTEVVRGVATTRYEAVIDFASADLDALEALGIDPDENAETFEPLREQFGIASIPVEVWVDSDGRVRRQRFAVGSDDVAGGTGPATPFAMQVELNVYDYGVEVDIDAPPADDVRSFSSVVGRTA